MGILEQYYKSRYANPEAKSTAPSTTVQRGRSNLTLLTFSGSVPPTYEQAVLDEKSTLRFSPTLADPGYSSYLRVEQSSYGTVVPPPPPVVDYMVTETGAFLMTENNDNLIL